MARAKDDSHFVFLARVERDVTGGISLHLIRDEDGVEVSEGAEYVTVQMLVDPFDGTA